MTYIKRDLEEKIIAASKEYACILITGARQVGKSTTLKKLMTEEREEVLLDNMEERKLALRCGIMYSSRSLDSYQALISQQWYGHQLYRFF